MRNQLDISVIANWVSMLRADIDGAILLVDCDTEGQFYEKCAHPSARIVPSPNIALTIFNQVKARRLNGIAAAITGTVVENKQDGVFQSELGDIASIFLASKSCDEVMSEAGGSNWFRACSKEVNSLVNRAIHIAIAIQESKFDKSIYREINLASEIDWNTLLPNDELKKGEILNISIDENRKSLLKKCDGTLVVRILAESTLRYHPRGISAAKAFSMHDLLSMMRLAFDVAEIESDAIFWDMRKWERGNIQYPLLKSWRLLDPLQVVLDQRYWESDLATMLKNDFSKEITAFKLDLDNFKQVNEKLGHSAGDAAIRLACSITKEILGSFGEVYRRGGDEIIALSQGLTHSDAAALAEKLRSTLADRFEKWGAEQGLTPTPTASIGVVFAKNGSASTAVTALLDEAQNTAKKEGKNRVICREHAAN